MILRSGKIKEITSVTSLAIVMLASPIDTNATK
jgi:hypothetical protein